jgi:hypothetical protein
MPLLREGERNTGQQGRWLVLLACLGAALLVLAIAMPIRIEAGNCRVEIQSRNPGYVAGQGPSWSSQFSLGPLNYNVAVW